MMKDFLRKVFFKDDALAVPPKASQGGTAEQRINELRDEIMDLQSKSTAINADRERLRSEIRQKELENEKLLDEYESLADGLEKDMVMGGLESIEGALDGLRERINTLNKALSDNEYLLQVAKQARERLQSAISAGKSPEEIARLICEIAQKGTDYDTEVEIVISAAGKLNGDSSGTDTRANANHDKVRARLAARLAARNGTSGNDGRQEPNDQSALEMTPGPKTMPLGQLS